MATLIYAARALIAYRRSKSEATDKSIVSPSSNAGSSIEDEDERIALFPCHHTHTPNTISQSNATSNETTAPANSPPRSDSISLDFRTVENNEVITLDSPAVVCIQKRKVALSNYETWAQMARKGEKFASSTPAIKIRASALNGQDDLILCHYHTVLLAIRIPVSRMSRNRSQKWTVNLVNALETVLCQEDPIRRRTGGCKSCFIVCNKNAQSLPEGRREDGYSVVHRRFGSVWNMLDRYFTYRSCRGVGVGATEMLANLHEKSELKIHWSWNDRDDDDDVRVFVKGQTELEIPM